MPISLSIEMYLREVSQAQKPIALAPNARPVTALNPLKYPPHPYLSKVSLYVSDVDFPHGFVKSAIKEVMFEEPGSVRLDASLRDVNAVAEEPSAESCKATTYQGSPPT